ncbi:MAG TPA: primosomal protein N' [Stellaceae bacterium]|nr:primosomal protein N' [Stellaceae bacterium]
MPSAAPDSVSVLLPLPLAGAYDYRVPSGMTLAPGDYVEVPLGKRVLPAVVWDRPADNEDAAPVEEGRLKPIARHYDVPPMNPPLRRFVDWVAAYTLSPPGAVLRMAMGSAQALIPPEPRVAYRRGPAPTTPRLTPARRRVLELLADGRALSAAELAALAGCGASVIKGMVGQGLVEAVAVPARRLPPQPDGARPGPALSPDQREAASVIIDAVSARRFQAMLLDGVTGSGKTEVYFAAIATALAMGRQVLVLLPEIALGAQWHDRFEQQFGAPAAAWHSDVSTRDRRFTWRGVAEGRIPVVVGARSALFLPFTDLGLIVVDEEHDPSYKQEDGVIYQARDMAVVRASLSEVPVVLASATPSLETLANVERGRYLRLGLPDRHGGATLPRIELIDLRQHKPERRRFLSPPLVEALGRTLGAGEQAMLFLNRRGYAPLTLCRTCGHRLECPNCTAWLVEHRLLGKLQCHHCGHAQPLPRNCSECGDTNSFTACGPGVERLAEEVAERFPTARTAVMASDTLFGPAAAADLVRAVREHEVDILIGTQMMAKGHHFPLLTLVGVVDADLGLAGGDLRAIERTYQLLHQVAGRAGRADRPGLVLLQSFMPEHPVMQALVEGDRDRFLAREADDRKEHGMPPFGRLAAVIVSADDAETVDFAARALARAIPHVRGVEVLGPAPAPLAILRSRHRRRFLVKATRAVNVQAMLRQWLGGLKTHSSVRLQVDVDPYSFL